MRAGKLRERVAIQALTRSLDNQGGYSATATYATITDGTVWASVESMGNSTELRAQAQTEVEAFEVEIRYRAGITTAHRILWGTRALRITGIKDPQQKHERLYITCEEAPGAAT